MEGDPARQYIAIWQRYFYPRPHMEGDGLRYDRSGTISNFYPRPHMEGDLAKVL